MGLRQVIKNALFLDDPPNADKPQFLAGGKARAVFPEDLKPRGNNRVRLLSTQGGSGPGEYGRGGDGTRLRNYSTYMSAITVASVYKAVNVIAAAFASSELRILDDDDVEVDIKKELPGFYALLKRPNPEIDFFTFREFMAYDLELTGNAVVALDSWNARGEPTEMFRLRPDCLRILRAPNGSLWYVYEVKGQSAQEPIIYAQDEIVHWKYANPKDPLWGLGTCEAGELTISTDRLLNEFTLDYFSRGAVLDGVLTSEGDMDDTEYNRLLTKWRASREGGGRNKLRTAILWQGASYQPIQEPLGNIPVVDLSRWSRNSVLELFSVPPAKVGDMEGINYNNSREADAYFWSEKMVPLLRRVEPGWDILLSHFSDKHHAAYHEYEIVDYKTRAETAFALAQTGAFTRNDVRVAAGYPPLDADDPLGDVFLGSTRQSLFPGEYQEPLDFLPMTPARLLGVEEDNIKQPTNFPGYTPGQGWTATAPQGNAVPAPSGTGGSGAGNGNGKPPPPSQQNRGARPTPPSARTRSGIGRSSTGRKSYPSELLTSEMRERLKRAEQEQTPDDPAQDPT